MTTSSCLNDLMATDIQHANGQYVNTHVPNYPHVGPLPLSIEANIAEKLLQERYYPWDQNFDTNPEVQKASLSITGESCRASALQLVDTDHLRHSLLLPDERLRTLPFFQLERHENDASSSSSDRAEIAASLSPPSTEVGSDSNGPACQASDEQGTGSGWHTAVDIESCRPNSFPSNPTLGTLHLPYHSTYNDNSLQIAAVQRDREPHHWVSDQPAVNQVASMPMTMASLPPCSFSAARNARENPYELFTKTLATERASHLHQSIHNPGVPATVNSSNGIQTSLTQYRNWVDQSGPSMMHQPSPFTPANLQHWAKETASSTSCSSKPIYVAPSAVSLNTTVASVSEAGDETPSEKIGTDRSDTSRDEYILRCRQEGWSYKRIKVEGGFSEAESTLRGRYRCLSKPKDKRVRRPEWTVHDVELLRQAVRVLGHGRGAVDKSKRRYGRRAEAEAKLPWKKIAEYILEKGGSYRFGNATCRKKWDEVSNDDGHERGAS